MSGSVAGIMDAACEQVLRAWRDNWQPTRVRVHPSVYDTVVEAKEAELQRGNTLLLLGLEVIPSELVHPDYPEVS